MDVDRFSDRGFNNEEVLTAVWNLFVLGLRVSSSRRLRFIIRGELVVNVSVANSGLIFTEIESGEFRRKLRCLKFG